MPAKFYCILFSDKLSRNSQFYQPRSQGLSSLPPFSTTMKAEKRDPGNEVAVLSALFKGRTIRKVMGGGGGVGKKPKKNSCKGKCQEKKFAQRRR